MGDPQDKPAPPGIPQWQQRSRQEDVQPQDQLEAARRFLEHDDVRAASRDEKARFLRSKGVSDSHIENLLAEPRAGADSVDLTADSNDASDARAKPHMEPDTTQQPPALSSNEIDHPSVVTYPEFLVKHPRPAPLVTTSRLLNTLYSFAGLSTLIFGVSKYIVAPMVENLTEARSDLQSTASHKLHALVAKLEKTVSEVPASGPRPLVPDDFSDAEDPFEMFHRDVGTQTSLTGSPAASAPLRSDLKSQTEHQADGLFEAKRSLSGLKDQLRAQSEDFEDVRTLLDVFRDSLDSMTYSTPTQFVGGYDIYDTTKRAEPHDEIRKVRDNIRLIKGILLSTRSFPASTR